MPLPQYLKFHCVNKLHASNDLDASSNANESFELNILFWKYDSNGAIEWSSEVTRTLTADVAGGASNVIGAEYNNSTNKYLGAQITAELRSDDTSHDGSIDVYVEGSTDAGTTYPSDKADFVCAEDADFVGSVLLTHSGSGTDEKAKNMWAGD